MTTTTKKPHVLVIPFPQSGHMVPHLDLTHQILLRGATVTVLVTPNNSSYLDSLRSLHSPEHFKTLILPFPSHPCIPSGVETLQQLPLEAIVHMFDALSRLHDPLVDYLSRQPPSDLPDAILGSSFLSPWINKVADAFSIKSISFLPINAHSISVMWAQEDRSFFDDLETATTESYGLVVNTFYELEPQFVETVKTRFLTHHRIWTVGPLLPFKAGVDRGGQSSIPPAKVSAWLDSCPEDNSVVYIGFGSQIRLTAAQTAALAAALEKSGVRFIWAVRDAAKKVNSNDNSGEEDVIPAGFEERVKEKGLVIRGWAPQTMILEHRAVGSYLTHLGWGSVLEGMVGGVLLLAWPMQADHFFNTTLVVDKLKAAVRVGENRDSVPDSDELARILAESVREDLPERVTLMKLREKGMEAIKEGGSSYKNLDELVAEMCV
ncbi:UDP-glucuronosyl/UDP-glucosyltransferase [Arabidopsis suecica]|uniref:UDP-glucuronosyl/UDP-glucosyltransferase n=1 Tax=Arabidopsis suecica TaxID=45249 RepID=A0A8T2H2A2_ARASU|nr:UDP-glucuronosyl/UDP-glucosyltransferase [Arabidopsis suecica]